MSDLKRDASEAEISASIERYAAMGYGSVAETRARHDEALGEGYKGEVCLYEFKGGERLEDGVCGAVYLAHHHMTRCAVKGCPMKDGQGSLLEQWKKELDQEVLDSCKEGENEVGTEGDG